MYKEYMPILMKSPLFKTMTNEQLELMLTCLKPIIKSYRKNELIAVEGSAFTGLGIIAAGEAAIYKENATGNRVMMNVLEPGEMFGEMVLFSAQVKWPATVQAQEECKVLFLAKEKIIGECEKVCIWHRSLIQNMLEIVSEKAIMLNKKVQYLTIKSMRGKICTFLIDQYKKTGNTTFTLLMNRNELADYLNVSRPSMSREMGRMRDEGIIDFYLSTMKILNLDSVKMLVE